MTALALQVSERMAQESRRFAKNAGLSRTAFIREAIEEKIERMKRQHDEQAMIKAFRALSKSTEYLKECEDLEGRTDDLLLDEEETWWSTP